MSVITACVIAYQSEAKIADLLNSLKGEVDHIVVGIDQKTTDKTEEVALSFGAITYPFDLADNFAAARTLSFEHAPEDTDWLLWIDTDDTLKCNTPLHEIADAAPADVAMIWFPYVYHRDEYGNVTTVFDRERLIRRSAKPVWQSALHETCHAPGAQQRDERAWVEQPNRTEEGKGERNFRILHKMLEDPSDHRARLYLAHQYFAGTDWPNACKWYETFIGLSSPGDVVEEKWQALIYLTKARRSMSDLDGSLRSANQALLMCPNYADAYYELAHTYALKGDYRRAIHWHEEGLTRAKPDRVMIQNPLDYTFNPFVISHQAYYKLGNLPKALEAVAKATTIRPNDANLVNPFVHYSWVTERTDAVRSAIRISEHLLETNEPLKAVAILANLPSGVQSQEIDEARAKVNARLAHLTDDVEYENFYFMEEEAGDPMRPILSFPRVEWVIERLRAIGAKRVLEVSIGDGVPAFRYAEAGFQVVGIDIDPRRVQRANQYAVKKGFLTESYKEEHRATTPDITPESRVSFHYGPAESIPQKVKDMGPFDAIILCELLEHVIDPKKVLDEADTFKTHIIITTPDGASSYQFFQNKAHPDSNHSGHVRALSTGDIEELIVRRGRLVESHILADEDFVLAAEYVTGENVVDRPPVVIYCGEGLEKWNPDQIDRVGLGGSETAVVRLAEQMVAKGLRVMVYGPSEGAWNGVYYRHYSKWRPQNPVFALISWRNPALFDFPINAKLKYLWMHDTDSGDALTKERMSKVDGVMALSQWHVNHLEKMYPFLTDQCFVMGNGLSPERFAVTEERNPNRFVYLSSPDRGLEHALVLWPKILECIPDATLDIYYGWENYDKMRGNPEWKLQVMAAARQPGVTWRGRIGQQELAKVLSRSGVMLYPSHHFNETFCIAALEAQAAGCVPVTRDNGALRETNSRGILVPSAAPDEQWVKAAVLGTKINAKRRKFLSDWALTQTWEAVTLRLLARMRSDAKEKESKEAAVA